MRIHIGEPRLILLDLFLMSVFRCDVGGQIVYVGLILIQGNSIAAFPQLTSLSVGFVTADFLECICSSCHQLRSFRIGFLTMGTETV